LVQGNLIDCSTLSVLQDILYKSLVKLASVRSYGVTYTESEAMHPIYGAPRLLNDYLYVLVLSTIVDSTIIVLSTI
jgi:hypothetical protein